MRENNYSGKSCGSHFSSGTKRNKRFLPNIGPQMLLLPRQKVLNLAFDSKFLSFGKFSKYA
jgi:hypothetical protein